MLFSGKYAAHWLRPREAMVKKASTRDHLSRRKIVLQVVRKRCEEPNKEPFIFVTKVYSV